MRHLASNGCAPLPLPQLSLSEMRLASLGGTAHVASQSHLQVPCVTYGYVTDFPDIFAFQSLLWSLLGSRSTLHLLDGGSHHGDLGGWRRAVVPLSQGGRPKGAACPSCESSCPGPQGAQPHCPVLNSQVEKEE